MKSNTLDIASMNFLLEVENAISFINSLGFHIQISEGIPSPVLPNVWIATVTIYTSDDEVITQGLSIAGGNREKARCIAIFESLERLFFIAYKNPDTMRTYLAKTSIKSDKIFEDNFVFLNLQLYKKSLLGFLSQIDTDQDSEFQLCSQKSLTSTGWAVGADIESACERAQNEVLERRILANIENLSSVIIPLDVSDIDIGEGLSSLAKKENYDFLTIAIMVEGNGFFVLGSMHDPLAKKTYYGCSFSFGDIETVARKAMEEILMEYYYSVIGKDERVGAESDKFRHPILAKIVSSKQFSEDQSEMNKKILHIPLESNLIFKIYPVPNKINNAKLYVVQTLAK